MTLRNNRNKKRQMNIFILGISIPGIEGIQQSLVLWMYVGTLSPQCTVILFVVGKGSALGCGKNKVFHFAGVNE